MKNVRLKDLSTLVPVVVTALSMLFYLSLSVSDSCYVAYFTEDSSAHLHVIHLCVCTKTSYCTSCLCIQCLKHTCLECKLYVLICAEDDALKYFTYAIVRCKHKERKKYPKNKGKEWKNSDLLYLCVKPF